MDSKTQSTNAMFNFCPPTPILLDMIQSKYIVTMTNSVKRYITASGLLKDPLTDEGSFTSPSQAVDPLPSGVCVCGAMVISRTAPYDSEHDYSEPPRNRKMRNRQFHAFNKGVMPFLISGGGIVQPGPIHTAHLLPRAIEVRSNAVGQLVM